MRNYKCKVLVIDSSYKNHKIFLDIFKNNNIIADIGNNVREGIQLAIDNSYDLIICQMNLEGQNGFHVYKILENYLIQRNTSFFILADEIVKDDFLIGLEMGVDNFIYTPIDKESVINKINQIIKKTVNANILKSNGFKNYFFNSQIPKFIIENNTIIKANSMFCELFDLNFIENFNLNFKDYFEFNDDVECILHLKKIQNGIIDHCSFKNVKCSKVNDQLVNLYMYSYSYGSEIKIIVELFSVNNDIHVFADCNENRQPVFNQNHLQKIKYQFNNKKIKLTHREGEILELSALGLPIKIIASKLDLSKRTIEKHRSNIMEKTKSHSIIEAISVLQNMQNALA